MSGRVVFLASLLGAGIGAPVAVSVLFFVAWKAAQKSASTVGAGSVSTTAPPPQGESGLRLVKPDDEQGSAS